MQVAKVKASATICGPCFYTQRGSFGVNQQEMEANRKQHKLVRKKHFGVILKQVALYITMLPYYIGSIQHPPKQMIPNKSSQLG